jgi:CubicO group peptidase (beta-lactamase class C family)
MKEQHYDEQLASLPGALRHSFRNRTMLVGTISFFLTAAFLFSTWNTIASVIPHTVHPKYIVHPSSVPSPLHIQWRPPLPRLNMNLIRDEQFASQIDRLLTTEVKQQHFSGSVLIARDNRVILSKGYSMASWGRKQANTLHTRFYLGSTTKQFTAMAILILQQQGKLNVHNSICMYLSSCPQAWQPVTIHDILTHTSGIPGVSDDSLSSVSPEAWAGSLSAFPMAFEPGSQFSYCNVCYQLLGYVIERVSGKPYSDFLQQAIFDPLQMKNTGFNPHYTSTPDHADGYDAWQDANSLAAWNLSPQWTFLFGAGLLYSTVEDMYRWDQALIHSTFVAQKTLSAAFTPYVASQYARSKHGQALIHSTFVAQKTLSAAFTPYATSQYAGSKYGYGWFLAQSPVPGHRLVWHDGKIPGFRTYNGFYPQDGITLIVLSNLATLDEIALAGELQMVLFAHPKMH